MEYSFEILQLLATILLVISPACEKIELSTCLQFRASPGVDGGVGGVEPP